VQSILFFFHVNVYDCSEIFSLIHTCKADADADASEVSMRSTFLDEATREARRSH